MVCPFRFCGEASAVEPPGTPEMASAEMDLCQGQHWKQAGYSSPRKKTHLGRKAGKTLNKMHLPPGLKRQGLDRKRNKNIKIRELLKFYELFLVKNNNNNNNYSF